MLEKILWGVENTWIKTLEHSLRYDCRKQLYPSHSWRWIVTTHQMKGISSSFYYNNKEKIG